MAKWSGNIGFTEQVEVEPGIWEDKLVARQYRGEVIRNIRRLQSSGDVNDNINISNQISIVADPYTTTHIYSMKYIEFQGAKWKITDVDVLHPRLNLTIGGLYNE